MYVLTNTNKINGASVILYDGLLNLRKCPSWNDDAISGTAKKGEVFTVMKKVKVEDSYMYKLKSGVYITASPKYVEVFEK